MSKYFFYLSADSHALEHPLGLEHTDVEGAKDCAFRIAQQFRPNPGYRTYCVVVMDQRGHKVAEAPIASPSDDHRESEDTRELSTV